MEPEGASCSIFETTIKFDGTYFDFIKLITESHKYNIYI